MYAALMRWLEDGNRAIGRFLIICMGLGFASLVAAGIAAVWLTAANERHTAWVNHTYQVEIAIDRASILIEQGETTRRGYLLTRQPIYKTSYRGYTAELPGAVDRIRTLTRDNPRQQANLRHFSGLIADILHNRERTIALVDAGRADEAVGFFTAEAIARRMRAIRDTATIMLAEERRLLALRDGEQRATIRDFYIVVAAAGLILLLVAAISLAAVFRYTRDLGRSRDALRDFNETLEDQVQTRTADLSRANEEIQRFAYIVSHDLRSPLVNVMGFTAELHAATAPLGALINRVEAEAPAILTEEARLAVREDLPEAIGFIRTSTEKMDRLINAILKLSREGRRVIAPERVDPATVIDGIAGSIAHLIDERGVTLSVVGPLPTLTTDRLALEQILSNLIENATKYLHPGRAGVITVTGREARGRVALAVADNGRGIAAADHERIFDLFRRSGRQDQPGEGIGLAHVRALAYRLGGTIGVTSTLGEGTTFTVDLPRTFVSQEATA